MKKIGVLSDTHNSIDDKIINFFKGCDEVWHAGDIGDIKVSDKLEKLFTFRGVYGNVDSYDLRLRYPKIQIFECEKVKVVLTHIGGYPGRYYKSIYPVLLSEHPKLFVCGHSHITKIMYDKKLELLHINPGAAGLYGIHKVRTAIRFEVNNDRIENLEILELERKFLKNND